MRDVLHVHFQPYSKSIQIIEIEIQVLEKGLEFLPVHRSLNEPELQRDFEQFARRMRIKWNF